MQRDGFIATKDPPRQLVHLPNFSTQPPLINQNTDYKPAKEPLNPPGGLGASEKHKGLP